MLFDSPNNAKALESLCDLYHRYKKPARESEYCKKAFIAAPDSNVVQSNVAAVYLRKEYILIYNI